MKETSKKKKWYSIVLNVLLDILIAVLVGLIALFVFITPVKIAGKSMENTLKNDQLVATWRFAPNSYKDGDVVTIKVDDYVIIKRVVATAGETIAFAKDESGGVFLYKLTNGQWKKTEEEYLKETPEYSKDLYLNAMVYDSVSKIQDGMTIQDGYVYVLGDNRNVSQDSRYYGQIATDDIISKMVFNISENGFMNFIFTSLFPFSKGETHND